MFRSIEYKKGLVIFASITVKPGWIRALKKTTLSSQKMLKTGIKCSTIIPDTPLRESSMKIEDFFMPNTHKIQAS